jgi:tetratricopeptide (TPR) repeat protein
VREKLRVWYEEQDKISLFLSLFVFLVSFIIYFRTMAPTVSFWDCGEFIACSYILGIPHPPGTPLFVLLGRVFTLIPLFGQIAARVNFISVLTSALTVWLCYLLIVKLVNYWQKDSSPGFILSENQSSWIKVGKYVGGVTGSLFLAFSNTFWSNAVEAEVYGASMFLMLLILYLGLLWMDNRSTPKGDKLLILISYLGFLSIGIHMTVFLIMPAIFLLVVLVDKEKLLDWRFWITGLVLALVMHSVTPFLVFMGGWFFLTFILMQISTRKKAWALSFLIIFSGMIGYSTQLFIPIRSSLEPAIDENNPSDWKSFKAFLERKQYGQGNMITRMFHRRGSWANQFGTKERMGFWGFFREQYGDKKWFIPLFLLGLFGIWEQIRKRKSEGTVLLFLVLAGTVGLILYMNFADGTKFDPSAGEIARLEVRDRDYFFTPGFMFFALFLGLGVSALIRNLSKLLEKKHTLSRPALIVLVAILLLLPICALKKNYHKNNRTGNWIPWDYAYNLLIGCDKDGILITNGDNDTFPLWFLQTVEKIRGDVRVVNLSLLNADWYILQRKDIWKVPIDLSYAQIKCKDTKMPDGRIIPRPQEPFYDPISKTKEFLFPYYDPTTKKMIRVQDMMVQRILLTNNWKYPFYFSSTVPPENRVGLDKHLKSEGLIYLVVSEEGNQMIDAEKYYRNLFQVYKYRGLNNINVYQDENTVGLLISLPEKFIDLALYYREQKQMEKAKVVLKKAIEVIPDYYRSYLLLYRLLKDEGKIEESDRIFKACEDRLKQLAEKYPEILYYHQFLGLVYQTGGKSEDAIRTLLEAFQMNPSDRLTFQVLGEILASSKKYKELVGFLERWVKYNPDDQQALQMLEYYKTKISP